MPSEIRRITEAFLHNPQRVEVSKPATTAATVTQMAVSVGREAHEKRDALRQLIRTAPEFKNAIIFCNRKREVAALHKSLVKHGFGAVALHGDLDQPARMAALEQFRKGEMPLLVASDVAARGLDIPEVSHVFNFDVPHHPDDYVHRVGRTGRAGRSGIAISLVSPMDEKSLTAIEKLTGQNIPRSAPMARSADDGEEPREERSSRDSHRRGGRKGPPKNRGESRGEGRGESRAEGRNHEGRSAEGRAHERPLKERHHEKERSPEAPAKRHAPPPPASSAKPAPGRRSQPQHDRAEPADHSHLPAFLLRPVKARA